MGWSRFNPFLAAHRTSTPIHDDDITKIHDDDIAKTQDHHNPVSTNSNTHTNERSDLVMRVVTQGDAGNDTKPIITTHPISSISDNEDDFTCREEDYHPELGSNNDDNHHRHNNDLHSPTATINQDAIAMATLSHLENNDTVQMVTMALQSAWEMGTLSYPRSPTSSAMGTLAYYNDDKYDEWGNEWSDW
jgi:hypothetical protein